MSFYLMHRGWRDHHLFKDQPYSDGEAWEHLISTANYAPSKFRRSNNLYDIPRGDLATSYRALGEKWKWSTNKVIRFLKLLQCDKMISLKTEHNFLQITLVNYEAYQNPNQEKETLTEQRRNSDGDRKKTETNTNQKKDKEIKKVKQKKDTPAGYAPEFLDFWEKYPRRDGSKAKAFEIYRSAIEKGISHERIESSVRAYAEYVAREGTETRHIAHATTWLSQSRWESDYSATTTRSSGKPTWKSESERLAAKYAAEAEREEQRAIITDGRPALCITEAIREDPVGVGNASGGIQLGTG